MVYPREDFGASPLPVTAVNELGGHVVSRSVGSPVKASFACERAPTRGLSSVSLGRQLCGPMSQYGCSSVELPACSLGLSKREPPSEFPTGCCPARRRRGARFCHIPCQLLSDPTTRLSRLGLPSTQACVRQSQSLAPTVRLRRSRPAAQCER